MLVYPGNDTLFIGEITKIGLKGGSFERMCSSCGECVLAHTAGICPVTRCAKGLVNGPCGGSKNGKCETDKDQDCVWLAIYDRLKENGQLEKMRKKYSPKNYSADKRPQHFEI